MSMIQILRLSGVPHMQEVINMGDSNSSGDEDDDTRAELIVSLRRSLKANPYHYDSVCVHPLPYVASHLHMQSIVCVFVCVCVCVVNVETFSLE